MYSQQEIFSFIHHSIAGEAQSITLIEKGVMTYKYEVVTTSADYIIRIFPKSIEEYAAKEYSILQKIYAAHCKTPRPLFLSEGNPHFIIYEKIPGKDLSHFLDMPILFQQSVAAAIAENIHHLSQVKLGHYGALLDDQQSYRSWNAFLNHGITSGFGYLSDLSVLEEKDINTIRLFMTRKAEHYFCPHPHITWSDFSIDNIIIHDGQMAGFVDFDGSMGGDPVLSLGYLFAKTGPSEFYRLVEKNFRNFFQFDFDDIVFYSIFRLARLAKYLHKPLPTGIERDPILDYFTGIAYSIKYVLNKT